MPETFWMEEYRKKAALTDAIAQSGRGNAFNAVDFLHLAKQVVELLKPRREFRLLDVGCANGLFDIILSASCHSILGIEPVPELAELARQNLMGCQNVRIEIGHGGAIPTEDNQFDRVLMLGVLQLIAPQEAKTMFKELKRVTKPDGRVLFINIPDKKHKQEFLEPYLHGVREAKHLSEEQKKQIIIRNQNSHWYDFEELAQWWQELGGQCIRHTPAAYGTDQSPRFHLEITFSA